MVSRPVTIDATHGEPPAEGLEAFVESFLRFLESPLAGENEETAIPGKDCGGLEETRSSGCASFASG